MVLVVLGGIVNNHRLYCKFFVPFLGLSKCLIIRGKVSEFSGKTLFEKCGIFWGIFVC